MVSTEVSRPILTVGDCTLKCDKGYAVRYYLTVRTGAFVVPSQFTFQDELCGCMIRVNHLVWKMGQTSKGNPSEFVSDSAVGPTAERRNPALKQKGCRATNSSLSRNKRPDAIAVTELCQCMSKQKLRAQLSMPVCWSIYMGLRYFCVGEKSFV